MTETYTIMRIKREEVAWVPGVRALTVCPRAKPRWRGPAGNETGWGDHNSVSELCLSTVTWIPSASFCAVGKTGINVFDPFPFLKGRKDRQAREDSTLVSVHSAGDSLSSPLMEGKGRSETVCP